MRNYLQQIVQAVKEDWKLLLFLLAFLVGIGLLPAIAKAEPASTKANILEIIDLSGGIGEGTASATAKAVETIKENPRVKAVLVVINSPGGGAVASSAVHEELGKLKVPVIVWCDHMCASGGVYAAMATSVKFIAVRSETIGGSVGVVYHITRFNRLLDWMKIDNRTFKSGVLKDSGNPTRPMNEEDEKYLQSIVDDLAQRFYAVVEKGRGKKIGAEAWKEIKTAKIFIGSDIVRVGLADAVMTKEQVIAKAKELAGVTPIFTRDELRKMSSAANENQVGYFKLNEPAVTTPYGDIPFVIELLKEVHAGGSVRFDYKMDYRF